VRILDLIDDYVLERNISDGAAYQIRHSVTLYGPERTIADLAARPVSEWLVSLEKRYSQRTVAGHRGNLLSIWRWCAGRGLCSLPAGVRRCPRPKPRPVAWTQEEFGRLLAAAEKMPNPGYWRLVLEVAYSSGFRRSDLWRITAEDLHGRRIWRSQHKTGCPHVAQVPQDAADAIRGANGCPLKPSDPRRFYAEFRVLCSLAGVRHGALQMCRRTGATQCEIASPGSATRYLGHLTPTMREAYVDRSQLPLEPVSPPLAW
jgi:integrase